MQISWLGGDVRTLNNSDARSFHFWEISSTVYALRFQYEYILYIKSFFLYAIYILFATSLKSGETLINIVQI